MASKNIQGPSLYSPRSSVLTQTGTLAPRYFSYDPAGRLSAVTVGDPGQARVSSYAYDTRGRLTSTTDPLGRSELYRYDSKDHLRERELPDGRIIGYAYDVMGNMVSITPPERAAHTFNYSSGSLLAAYTPPQGIATAYHYIPQTRELDAITRPDGTAILFNRDYAGRIAEIQSATGNLVHSYNAATGDLDSVTAGSVTVFQEYASGFPIATRVTSPDFTGSVKWSFNRKMDVVTERVTLGALQSLVTYRHDGDGLLTGDDNFIADRDPANGLVTETHLGAVSGYEAYNSFGELMGTSFSYGYGAPLYTVSYTRDGVGRVATKTENIEGTTWTYGYTYDTAGRLTAVDRNGQPFATYTYDPNGNRLSHTREGDIREGTYDGEDRVQTYGYYQYFHTANGELESRMTLAATNTSTYKYNAFGDLTRAALPDGRIIEYVVDGMQRRVAKKVNGAFVEGYLYKNELQIAADVGSNGELRNRYVYASGRRLPDYFIRAGEQYRILTDHLGSVRLVVNSLSGNVAQRIDYDEFGAVLYDSNPGFQPFGFAGGLYDADTGLVRFGARDYDPYTGRWTAKDPILFEGGDTNLYGYVLNDPMNSIDSDGLIAYVCQQGSKVNIQLPLQFSGQGADLATTTKFKSGIQKIWSGKFGKYDVTMETPSGPDNKIVVPSGDGRAYVQGGNTGRWPSDRPAWTAAHEAGHLMGLPDRYSSTGPNSGYESNIMGARDEMPSAADIKDIIANNPKQPGCK